MQSKAQGPLAAESRLAETNEASPINVRQCRSDDFPATLALLAQLWPKEPLDAERLRRVFNCALASDSQIYLCATDGDRIIGFGSLTVKNNLWPQGYLGLVDELVVDEKHRGQGVGTRLLEHLATLAKQRGCRRLELDSAFQRTDAHEFYERQGFGRRAYLFSKAL